MSSPHDLIRNLAARAEGPDAAFAAFEAWGFERAVFADFSLENGTGLLRGASSDYPVDWLRLYVAEELGRFDPVLRRARSSVTPIDWASFAADTSARRFFSMAQANGVGRHGVTIPLHAPRGGFAVLSLSADCSEAAWRGLLDVRTADAVLVAHHLLASSSWRPPEPPPALSGREAECLRWCAAGKTVLEIASIIGVSERTVRFHLENARRKLDAVNSRHAAARALQFGLISCG
jgi:DNA-binding CsgD family transcriptional regulator